MSFSKRNGHNATPPVGFETMLSRFSSSPILSDLQGAMAKAVAEYKSAHDAVTRIAGDKTLTDGARVVRQATVARAKMDGALTALENARDKIAAGRKNVEAELRKRFDYGSASMAELSLATELRAHVKNLPDAERGKFMLSAIEELDLNSMRAIAAAPAFLSGIPPQLHELARDKFLSVMAPEQVETAKTLRDGEAFAENLHAQMSQATANLVDFDSADEIAKNAAAA